MPVRTSGINVRRFSVNIGSEAFFRGIEGGRVLVDKPIQANLDKSSRRSEL